MSTYLEDHSPQDMLMKIRSMEAAIDDVLAAADAKDQPTTSKNIPVALIERLREVAR